MKLYYMKGACSLASFISLTEAGIPFEPAEVDRETRKTKEGEELNVVNSKGYVPVLRLDDGQVLTENVAVLQYIADRKPEAKLAPAPGTLERARLVEFLGYINSELHKNFGPLFNASNSEDIKNLARSNLHKRLTWLNNDLGSREYLLGSQFSVADAYLYVVLRWTGRVGIGLEQWPALKKFSERVGSRPGVAAALKAEGLS